MAIAPYISRLMPRGLNKETAPATFRDPESIEVGRSAFHPGPGGGGVAEVRHQKAGAEGRHSFHEAVAPLDMVTEGKWKTAFGSSNSRNSWHAV